MQKSATKRIDVVSDRNRPNGPKSAPAHVVEVDVCPSITVHDLRVLLATKSGIPAGISPLPRLLHSTHMPLNLTACPHPLSYPCHTTVSQIICDPCADIMHLARDGELMETQKKLNDYLSASGQMLQLTSHAKPLVHANPILAAGVEALETTVTTQTPLAHCIDPPSCTSVVTIINAQQHSLINSHSDHLEIGDPDWQMTGCARGSLHRMLHWPTTGHVLLTC